MFKPVGKIEKVHDALQVQVDGWQLGQLVIAAADVPKLLNGREVDVNFVQQRDWPGAVHRLRRQRPDLPERPGGEREG
jgi:hypothetical protein